MSVENSESQNVELNQATLKDDDIKSIFDCWSEAIRRFFDVKGRTTRYEFWAFQTVSLAIFIVAALIGWIFSAYKIVFEIYALYFLAPFASCSARRFHDINISGYWSLPAVALALLVLLCWELQLRLVMPLFLLLLCMSYMYWFLSKRGDDADNKYGAKISEPSIYNQDSKYFVNFMMSFLAVLWLAFLISLF